MSAFCTECGTQLNEGARFCPECGHAVSGAGGGSGEIPEASRETPNAGQSMAPGQQLPPVQQMSPGRPIPPRQQMPLDPQMPPGQQIPFNQQLPPGTAPIPGQFPVMPVGYAPVGYVPVYAAPMMAPRGPRVPGTVVAATVVGILAGLTGWLGPSIAAQSMLFGENRFSFAEFTGIRAVASGEPLVAALAVAGSVFVVVCASLCVTGRGWCRVVLVSFAALAVIGGVVVFFSARYWPASWMWELLALAPVVCGLLLVLPPSNRFFARCSARRLIEVERRRQATRAAWQPRAVAP